MKAPFRLQAMMLGVLVVASACDIAEFVLDPMPRFEQTWNLPASSDTITIASLLPTDNSITVLPDSSGFRLSPPSISISQAVGPQCAQCQALNGTTAPKPAFTLVANNAVSLATDVVSASVIGGTVNISLTNNMSFDPLQVTAGPGTQGHMIIVIRSGSVVFGKDSVNGATTPWAPGTQLIRVIPLNSGTAPATLAAEVTLVSPAGDSKPINANGTLNATASIPTLDVSSVNLNIVNRQMLSGSTEIDLSDVDDITDYVTSGTLQMTITNPLALTGNVDVRFRYGAAPSEVVTKTISLPTGVAQVRSVTLNQGDMQQLLGNTVTVSVTGTVNSTGPISLTPRLKIVISNRLILGIITGGGQ